VRSGKEKEEEQEEASDSDRKVQVPGKESDRKGKARVKPFLISLSEHPRPPIS